MKISMIAAMANNRVIGKENGMPWHLPADFAWFKQHTLGKPILMGRKTYESIGKALPHRRNIVITRDLSWSAPDIEVVHDIETALDVASEAAEVVVIGGGSIYRAFLPRADRLYLTFIDATIDGDTYFPDWGYQWVQSEKNHVSSDEKNQYAMDFVILDRVDRV